MSLGLWWVLKNHVSKAVKKLTETGLSGKAWRVLPRIDMLPAFLPSGWHKQGAQGALPIAANVLHGCQEESGPGAAMAL